MRVNILNSRARRVLIGASLAVAAVSVSTPAQAVTPQPQLSSTANLTSTDSPYGAKGSINVTWGHDDTFSYTAKLNDVRSDGRGAIMFVYRDTEGDGPQLLDYEHELGGSGAEADESGTYNERETNISQETKAVWFQVCNGGTQSNPTYCSPYTILNAPHYHAN